MNEELNFYICPVCGNVITLLNGEIDNIKCCGRKMEKMEGNVTDAATEKHLPVCVKEGEELVVNVGEVEHPMEEEHYIMWIAQVKENRATFVKLQANTKPIARFPYEKGATIYSYCNKHGLWKMTIE